MSNFSIRYMATAGLLYLAGAYSVILVLPLQAQSISLGISFVGSTNDLSIGNPNSFAFPALRPMVIADSPTTDPDAKPADSNEDVLDPETDSPVSKVSPIKKTDQINDSDPIPETNNAETTAPPKAPSDSEIPICPVGTPFKDC